MARPRLAVLLSIACLISTSAAGAKGRAPRLPAAECKVDADCTLVADGCCGCDAGGKQKAIPAGKKQAAERARAKRCVGTVCVAMMSTDPSCGAAAVCQRGACRLEPAARKLDGVVPVR